MTENDKPLPEIHLTHSPAVGAIGAALAKAQGILESAPKNHTAEVVMKSGGKYSYSYADLAGVWDAGRGPLSANGLALTQAWTLRPDGLAMTTLLIHSSGEWIRGEMAGFPVPDRTPQGVGTSVTYARRYNVGAMVGIVSEEDDDGGNGGKPKTRAQRDPAAESGSRSDSGAPSMFPNFGPAKGEPIRDAKPEHLETYLAAAKKSLADPSKAKWHAKESALIGAYEAEMKRQKEASGPVAGVPKDFAPYQQAVILGTKHGWLEDNVKHWLKTKRGKSGSATVTAEDVEALRVALEPPETKAAPPGDEDAPF